MKFKLWLSAAAVTVLAACSQPKLPEQADWSESVQVPDFTADGRLSVKVEEKGSYANFDWTYQNQVQTISINTPLGSTLGQLCQDGEGVLAVDSKGKKYQAPTAAGLQPARAVSAYLGERQASGRRTLPNRFGGAAATIPMDDFAHTQERRQTARSAAGKLQTDPAAGV